VDVVAALVILAAIGAVGFVLSTPWRSRDADVREENADRLEELEARKQAKYGEIRDAEMDFKTGKLSAEDHRALDRQLRAEAMEILRGIDEQSG
jgi:hypothetical protein